MDRASPSPRLPRASRDALLNCQELDQVSRPEVLSGNASKLIQREIIYRSSLTQNSPTRVKISYLTRQTTLI